MIQLGKTQTLKVLRSTSVGLYLGEAQDPLAVFARKTSSNPSSMTQTSELLLPKNEYKSAPPAGSELTVFVYKDSSDRPIATLKKPLLEIGGFALLTVKEVTPIGAFLDWGLVKDLFLPYREQTAALSPGKKILVTLYVDKSSRLCASMKLYRKLLTSGEFSKGQWVGGHVYEISDRFGAFVAVEDRYSALIPKATISRNIEVGEEVKARIVKVLDDGRLELSLHDEAHKEISADCERVLELLKENGGFMPYHDKSDPGEIRRVFGMTKNEFKRAIGHLYKLSDITIGEDGIYERKE